MDLADIRQQVLSSNTSARKKAEALLLERVVYELNRKEWRELLAGIPSDVKRQIGILMSAGKQRPLVYVTVIIKA